MVSFAPFTLVVLVFDIYDGRYGKTQGKHEHTSIDSMSSHVFRSAFISSSSVMGEV